MSTDFDESKVDYFVAPIDGTAANVQILNTALRVFIGNGIDDASVRSIAGQAKRSESQIYKEFGRKKGLVHAVFDRCWAHIWKALDARLTGELRAYLLAPDTAFHRLYADFLGVILAPGMVDKAVFALVVLRRKPLFGYAYNAEFAENCESLNRVLRLGVETAESTLAGSADLREAGWQSERMSSLIPNTAVSLLLNAPDLDDIDISQRVKQLESKLQLGPDDGGGGYFDRDDLHPTSGTGRSPLLWGLAD